jgi:hypothetical protein
MFEIVELAITTMLVFVLVIVALDLGESFWKLMRDKNESK